MNPLSRLWRYRALVAANPESIPRALEITLDWRVLGILNLYRVLVPLVLVSLYSLGGGRGLSVDSPRLFFSAAVFYLVFGLFSIILVRNRLGSAYLQTILQATLDIIVLMLLVHACGGVAGGLGLLLLVPVGSLVFLLPVYTVYLGTVGFGRGGCGHGGSPSSR